MMCSSRESRRKGLGLVELLIALAISATLLTSVAVAFHASLNTVEQNQQIASVTQNARVLLHRMMADARTAVDIECTSSSVSILPPLDGSGVTQTEYELVDGVLYYRVTKDGTSTSYMVLGGADNVEILQFNVDSIQGQDANGQNCTKSMTATLDLQVGSNRFAVTASASPRGNQDW